MAKNKRPNKQQAAPRKKRAAAFYFITCIWMLTAVINFVLGYASVAALFVALGVLTLLLSIYADWRESHSKK